VRVDCPFQPSQPLGSKMRGVLAIGQAKSEPKQGCGPLRGPCGGAWMVRMGPGVGEGGYQPLVVPLRQSQILSTNPTDKTHSTVTREFPAPSPR